MSWPRRCVVVLALALLLGAFVVPSAHAATALIKIPIVGVMCTGAWPDDATGFTNTLYRCDAAFDGITDDTSPRPFPPGGNSYWLGRETSGGGVANETLTFDLGARFVVTGVELYNTHNDANPADPNDRGTLNFRMWVSNSAVTPDTNASSTFGTEVLSGTLQFFPSVNPNPSQPFVFPTPTQGRYLTFRAETFHQLGAGLSEIVVYGAPAAVSAWSFDEGVGTIAGDSVDGNQGALLDGAAFVASLHGTGVNTNGGTPTAPSRVEVANSSNLTLTSAVTVEAMVRLDAPIPTTGSRIPVAAKWGCGCSSPGAGYGLFFLPGTGAPEFLVSTDGGCCVASNSALSPLALPLHTWHHLVGTYDGTKVRLFVDGVLVKETAQTGAIFATPAPFIVGNYSPNATPPAVIPSSFPGVIDQVAVYDGALGAGVVKQLAQQALNVRAYVVGGGDATLRVFDVASATPTDVVSLAASPVAARVNPAGTEIYVPTQGLSIVDAANAVVSTIPVAVNLQAQGLAVAPDGTKAFLGNAAGPVIVFDLVNRTVIGTLPTTGGAGMAVRPDGTTVFISNAAAGIDEYTVGALGALGTFVRSYPGLTNTNDIAISPDGTRLYAATTTGVVHVVDLQNNVALADITPLSPAARFAGIAVSLDGTRLYVAQFSPGNVLVVDAATGTVVSTVLIGGDLHGLELTPDGSELWVSSVSPDAVSVVDTTTNQVVDILPAGSQPLRPSIGAMVTTGPPPASTDLRVTNVVAPSVAQGGTATYTLTVTNLGAFTATGVTLSDTVGSDVGTVLSATASQGFCLAPPNGTVRCTLGSIAAGQSATVMLAVRITAPVLSTVANTVAVGATTLDPNGANNLATSGTVVALPVPVLGVSSSEFSTTVGGTPPSQTIPVTGPGTLSFTTSTSLAVPPASNWTVAVSTVVPRSSGPSSTSVTNLVNGVKLHYQAPTGGSGIGTETRQYDFTTTAAAGGGAGTLVVNVKFTKSVGAFADDLALFVLQNGVPVKTLIPRTIGDFSGFDEVYSATLTLATGDTWGIRVVAGNFDCCEPVAGDLAVVTLPIALSPTGGTTPASVTLSADPSQLPTGNYVNEVTFTNSATGDTTTLPVTVHVGPAQGPMIPRTWFEGGALNVRRYGHGVAKLPDGRVVIAGGLTDGNTPTSAAEIRDPATSTWKLVGPTLVAHGDGAQLVTLANGTLLLVGGTSAPSIAEIFDPMSLTWRLTGNPTQPRDRGFTATRLTNGRVLIVGGESSAGSAELYDPTLNSGVGGFVATATPPARLRTDHAAVRLKDGMVLVTGGQDGAAAQSAEVFDPGLAQFTLLMSSMTSPRASAHAAVVLPNGQVLVVGGSSAMTADLYDPDKGVFVPTATPSYAYRSGFGAIVLPSGNVLVVGGQHTSVGLDTNAEIYMPATPAAPASWVLMPGAPRNGVTDPVPELVLLDNGRVLLAGGRDKVQPSTGLVFPDAEVFASDPVRAYVANFGEGTVTVVDGASNTRVETLASTNGPVAVAANPVRSEAYVLNQSAPESSFLGFDTRFGVPLLTVPLGSGSVAVAVKPDGTTAYVTRQATGSTGVLDRIALGGGAAMSAGEFAAGPFPKGLAFHPSANTLYVLPGLQQVWIWDTTTDTLLGTIPLTGADPTGIAVAPDGSRLWVTNVSSNDVSVVDLAANVELFRAPVGTQPMAIAISPDGTRLYVANTGSNTVSVLETKSSMTIGTLNVPSPQGLALSPDARRLYVTTGNTVQAFDVSTNTLVATVPAGNGAAGVAFSVAPGDSGGSTFADLAITISGPSTIGANQPATYIVHVQNNGAGAAGGTGTATTIGVGGIFSFGTSGSVTHDRPTEGTCTFDPPSGLLRCSLPSLLSGNTWNINVTVTRSGAATFANSVSVGAVTTDFDVTNNNAFVLTTISGATITGTVTDPNNGNAPIAGATVRAADGPTNTQTTTNGAGVYSLSVQPGSYHVQAIANGYVAQYNGGFAANFQAPFISVPNGGSVNVNFALQGGPNAPAGTRAGGFSGRVTNASIAPPNNGIGNAVVAISLGTGGFIMTVPTDALGNYSTGATLAPGKYNAQVIVAGFPNVFFPSTNAGTAGGAITVTQGTVGSGFNFSLQPATAGGISGFVKDAANNPVPFAGITITTSADQFSLSTSADASGHYDTGLRLVPSVSSSTYKVQASATGFATQFYNGQPSAATATLVTVPSNAYASPVDGINFTLGANAGISGTVTDLQGTQLGGVFVDVISSGPNNPTVMTLTTDANGFFTNGALSLQPGDYFLRARVTAPRLYVTTFYNGRLDGTGVDLLSATKVTAVAGATAANTNIAMPIGATITGFVREQGTNTPIQGASVFIGRFQANNFSGTFGTTTDATGQFKFFGIRDGEWTLRAEPPCPGPGSCHQIAWFSGLGTPATDNGSATAILVTSGSPFVLVSPLLPLASADITVAAGGGALTGRVLRSNGAAAATPVPANTIVQVATGGGASFPRANFVTQVNTDATGTYVVRGLPPGPYIVQVLGSQTANGFSAGWYPTGATSAASAFSIPVTNGVTTPVDDFVVTGFTGGATPRTISGKVTDVNGQPVQFGSVSAIDPQFNFGVRGTSLNGDGSYTIPALPPGKYFVRVQTEGTLSQTSYELRVWPDETVVNAGALVDVTAQNQTGIDMHLPTTSGMILGQVKTNLGVPVPGVNVSVRNFFDGSVTTAITRQDGTYIVRGLPAGDYKLRTQSVTGFSTAYYSATGPSTPLFDDGSFVHVPTGNAVGGKDITLTPASGRITGTVYVQLVDPQTGAVVIQPVVGAGVQFRDAVTGSTVNNAPTRADGSFAAEGLLTGAYKLRVAPLGLGVQWNGGARNEDAAAAVNVTSGGPDVININFTMTPAQGGLHGRIFDGQGQPLRNVGISLFDAAGFGQGLTNGFVIGSNASDSSGQFFFDKLAGLAPGTYIAQTRGLGYAREFAGPVGQRSADVATASQFPITVAPGPGANITITVTRTADIRGTISYAGAQPGALKIGVFCDSGFTRQVYGQTIASPTFPVAYTFTQPAPDTRGLLPATVACGAGGQYYVAAHIDNNPNGIVDATEPQAIFGQPTGISLAEGDIANVDLTLTENVTAGGTQTFAQGVLTSILPTTGGTIGLGNIEIDENGAESLSTSGRIRVTLPLGLTFVKMPTVSVGPGWGLSIVLSGPGAPALENGNKTFSFQLASRSRGGSATIVVGGMVALVPGAVVPTNSLTVPIAVTVDATVPNGLTPATVQTASVQGPPPAAVFTTISMSTDFAGLGVTRDVVLDGFNLGQLTFCPNNVPAAGCATIDFGAGITAQGTPVVSADGTQITVTIKVDPTAQTGRRTVVIHTPAGDLTATMDNGGSFNVDPLPVLITAGTVGTTMVKNGTGHVVSASGAVPSDATSHVVNVVGSGFISPQSPGDLKVRFNPSTGITVDDKSVVLNSDLQVQWIAVTVTVANGAETIPFRDVTVTNSDGGVSNTVASALAIVAPQPNAIIGLEASKTSGSSTPPAVPTISSMTTPAPAGTGSPVTINGTGFSTTLASNVVTFTGANASKITATPTSATTGQLSVRVPSGVVTGGVTVTVGTSVSAPFSFAVTNPRPSGATPSSALQGATVTLDITGANFQSNISVALSNPTNMQIGPVTFLDSTHIRVPVTLKAANGVCPAPAGTPSGCAAIGLHDLTLTNPDGGVGTLPGALQVNLASTTSMTLTFTDTTGGVLNTATWLPSVQGVQVTLDGTGKCTGKTITPTLLTVRADLSGTTLPTALTFSVVPSAIPGTATNEDCEISPAGLVTTIPNYDFTIGTLPGQFTVLGTTVDATLPVSSSTPTPLSVTVPVVINGTTGVAQAQLASWDWGGKVMLTVADTTPTVSTTITLPYDSDGDDLPDVYESNQVPNVDNTDANGVNVLDATKRDQNGNGVSDRNDRFALDGLTNFEKYRGVYMQGPLNGTTGAMQGQWRLGAGKRNLFARGRGFATDPAIVAKPGTCGVDSAGNPAANLLPQFPCPAFQIGDAFTTSGIKVWDVAAAFTSTSVLPTKSYANPATPTLDMATVTLDAVNCSGGSACDHSGKTGIRQWQFPTLGFSTFGSGTTYGDARVFLRAMSGYFNDRPYLHQENVAGKFIPANGTRPMLAPITIICDNGSTGSDDGVAQTGECVAPGTTTPGGDVFTSGVFAQPTVNGINLGMTAMDVNNDNCVELPFVADPTTLVPCDATAGSAVSPQATFQQVVRSIATHELGHATGINIHTADSTDLMYQYSINWTRDGHFSPSAAALLQVHNKGQQ